MMKMQYFTSDDNALFHQTMIVPYWAVNKKCPRCLTSIATLTSCVVQPPFQLGKLHVKWENFILSKISSNFLRYTLQFLQLQFPTKILALSIEQGPAGQRWVLEQ